MSPFDIANSKQELQQLEQKTTENDFWQKDQKETSKILAQIKQLKSKIEKYENADSEVEELIELTELANLEKDEEVAKEIIKSPNKLEQ